MKHIWIFNGDNSRLPAGAFSEKKLAESWIKKNGLSGILTKYPVDTALYDWAVDGGFFTPKRDKQKSAEFIQSFTCAYADHYHYVNGIKG